MTIHARLHDALAALINDLVNESTRMVVTDYGFSMLLGSASQDDLAEAMNEILGDKLKSPVAITVAEAVDIADPRSGMFYFKYGPVPGTVLEEVMAPEYFSLSSSEVMLHTAASAEEVARRRADLEAFQNEVQCRTAGERNAKKLQQNLLKTICAKVSEAVQREHCSGLEFRLKAAARIVGAKDLYSIDRNLEQFDLPTLCAVLSALGADEEFDYL